MRNERILKFFKTQALEFLVLYDTLSLLISLVRSARMVINARVSNIMLEVRGAMITIKEYITCQDSLMDFAEYSWWWSRCLFSLNQLVKECMKYLMDFDNNPKKKLKFNRYFFLFF